MDFSVGHLQESFEKYFSEGLKAKEKGNIKLAKEKLSLALSYLDKLVAATTGDTKEKHKVRAQRLKQIIDSMDVNKTYPTNQTKPNNNGGNSSSYTGSSQSGGTSNDNSEELGYEDVRQFITLFKYEDLKFGFEGVMGLDEAKEAVTEYIINPIRYKDAYNYDFMDNKAILLYGPPGTGKTTFAKAVAKETGLPFFLVNMSSIVNCYIGETAKNIDKIFDFMRNYTESNNTEIVVFFDEFDEIAKSREGSDKTSEAAVPALLRNLDGVKENKGFMVLANTNYKDKLDKAVLSRFRQKVYIPLPDKTVRINLYKLSLKDIEVETLEELDFGLFSKESEGLSGRDIAYIADDFKRIVSKTKAGLIEKPDFNAEMVKIIKKKQGGEDGTI